MQARTVTLLRELVSTNKSIYNNISWNIYVLLVSGSYSSLFPGVTGRNVHMTSDKISDFPSKFWYLMYTL